MSKPFNYSDLWDAYVAGVRDGQRHPTAPESIIQGSADAYCKLKQAQDTQIAFAVREKDIKEVVSEVYNEVFNKVGREVDNKVFNKVGREVYNEVLNEVHDEVENEVRDEVDNKFRHEVGPEASNEELKSYFQDFLKEVLNV